ncbi:MAG TPA: response regulator transcription factor [Thermomicrobiales bacterium]|nr:response regulator transcription factor [Thermomicrobiales bacterium]
MQKRLILVADDDAPILRLVRTKLQTDGYHVVTATNGQEALDRFEVDRPDLIVLDIMMPVMDGIEALRRIRTQSNVPVILLTARTAGRDKVRSLDLGADDYVTKPFDPDELSARVAAVLRRATIAAAPAEQVLHYDGVTIELTNRRVLVGDEEIHLSRTEWEVLSLLAANPGRVMTHGELLGRIWGPAFRDETSYLRTWISRIRKKLGDTQESSPLIRTFPGIGYRLESPPDNGHAG